MTSNPPAHIATAKASKTAGGSKLPVTPTQAPAGAMAKAHPSNRLQAQV